MSKPRVYITRGDYHPETIAQITQNDKIDADVFQGEGGATREEFLQKIKGMNTRSYVQNNDNRLSLKTCRPGQSQKYYFFLGVSAVLIMHGKDVMDKEAIDAAGVNLKVVSTHSVG